MEVTARPPSQLEQGLIAERDGDGGTVKNEHGEAQPKIENY